MSANLDSNDQRKYYNSEVSWAAQSMLRKKRPLLAISFLIVYVCFFGIFIFYSFTVKIPTRVDAQGRLTSSKEPVPIKSPAAFVVGELLVKENQNVKAKQILMTSREALTDKDKATLSTFLLRTKTMVNDSKDQTCLRCLPQIEAISQMYVSINAQGDIRQIIQPIHDLLQELANAVRVYKKIEPSVSDLRMNIRLNEEKLREVDRREARKVLAKEVEQMEAAIVADKTRIEEKYQSSQLDIQRLRTLVSTRLSELGSKLELYEKTFNVVAPFDGKITNLRVKGAGEQLGTNDVLMELVPYGVQIMAKINVRNEDISKVQAGQEVIISVDALDEVDYGTVRGKVLEILRNEDTGEDIAGTKGTKYYQVLVQLSQQYLEMRGVKSPFLIGMSVQARVVSGYETIANNFLKSVLRVGERAGVK